MSSVTNANVLTGGYINVKYVSGTTYNATCTVYSNSTGQKFQVLWGDGSSTIQANSSLVNTFYINNCPCGNITTFSIIHTFPGPGTYRITLNGTDSSSNPDIPNSKQLFYAFTVLTINPAVGYNVSTPTINTPLIALMGHNAENCYQYTLSVLPSTDSIVYSLGESSVLNGSGFYSPPDASIDRFSGTLSWCTSSGLAGDSVNNFTVYIISFRDCRIGTRTVKIPIDTVACVLAISYENEPLIYPNPGNGKFAVQLPSVSLNARIELYDVLGRKLLDKNLPDLNTPLDISGFAKGVYIYRLYNEPCGLNSSGKFIKE